MPRLLVTWRNEFIGLNLNTDEHGVAPSEAVVAENVFVESGQVETRPGRKRLAEDQEDVVIGTGIANYTPPSLAVRSVVIVRPDGIFQRTG